MFTNMMIFKILVSIFLIWVSIHDIKYRKIEHFTVFIIIAAAFFLTDITIAERIAGFIICFLPIGIASFATNKMGMGDAKVCAAFGFVLGVYKGLSALVAGLFLMVVISGIYSLVTKKYEQKPIPLAPYLCAGFLIFLYL